MSVVANVLLLTAIDDSGVEKVNDWLRTEASTHTSGELKQVDDSAGGTRAMEVDVWAGAFNYLCVEEFLSFVRTTEFDRPDSMQLLICEQDEDKFYLRAGSRTELEYRHTHPNEL